MAQVQRRRLNKFGLVGWALIAFLQSSEQEDFGLQPLSAADRSSHPADLSFQLEPRLSIAWRARARPIGGMSRPEGDSSPRPSRVRLPPAVAPANWRLDGHTPRLWRQRPGGTDLGFVVAIPCSTRAIHQLDGLHHAKGIQPVGMHLTIRLRCDSLPRGSGPPSDHR
jgi:hypothetical protein